MLRSSVSAACLVVALSGSAAPAVAAVAPPVLAEKSLDDLRPPIPYPYDDAKGARVDRQIDAAFVRAKASNKRVLVHMGGNWCGWCRILAAVMSLPDAKPFVNAHFEVVTVNITPNPARVDRNLQVLRRFGVDNADGFPFLVVADANGQVLVRSSEITDERHQTPQAMIDWLAQWAQ